MKKKLLAIVIAIVLMLTNAITIYANTGDTVTATSDKTELKAGETFTITLEVSAASGIAAVTGFSYSYDTEKLEVNETIASTFMNFEENNVRTLMYVGDEAVNAEMATLTFSVKEGVDAGTTTISFGEMVVASMDNPNVEDNTPISLQPISITVINETTPPEGDGEGEGEGEQDPPTECEHTYDVTEHNDTEHWNECSKCEEEGTREAHNYSYTDNKNGTHTATCTVCSYQITGQHDFNNGACNDCDAVQPTDDECDHTYDVTEQSDTEHWNVCSKCDEEEEGSREEHNYSYTDDKDGTHTATCTVCDYQIKGEHDFNNGVCNDCDAVQLADNECEHTYESGSNDIQHWEACSKCGRIKSGTLKTHTYESYSNNNDGTHTAKCSECGHEHKESHATNVACEKCGYKPTTSDAGDGSTGEDSSGGGSTGGSSTEGDDNSKDEDKTVADKEIPKAGLNTMLALGIVAIVVVSVVMYIKNKKYQDIK